MDHNEFDFTNDLIRPFSSFLKQLLEKEIGENCETEDLKASKIVHKERYVTSYSDIDDSCVDYQKDSKTFDMYFDSKLYEPPERVKNFEKLSR
jgi:hypothetical protein